MFAAGVDQNMGAVVHERQSESTQSVVAFDFDGTLTVRDSFTAFMAGRTRLPRDSLAVLRLLPELLLYPVLRDRGRLKGAVVRRLLAGLSPDQLAQAAEAFAQSHAHRLFRPDALETWRAWKAKGALMVIVSASPEAVLEPFARRLDADRLIATRLTVDTQGRLALDGANCRGPEKVRRLRAEFGPNLRLAAAYGDTAGDREMLALADERGYRVFTGRAV
jgi:phosphatidylglycerophosphatase C